MHQIQEFSPELGTNIQTTAVHSPPPAIATTTVVAQIENRMLEMCGDLKDPLIPEILDVYSQEAVHLVERIHVALETGQGGPLKSAAHSLAGASQNIGASGFGGVLGELEIFAATMSSPSDSLVSRLDDEYSRVRLAIESIRRGRRA